jgi:hypothetical protein
MEVVSLSERKPNLHSDLLDLIFNWTAGHVRAVVEPLRILSVCLLCQPQLLKSLARIYQRRAMGTC